MSHNQYPQDNSDEPPIQMPGDKPATAEQISTSMIDFAKVLVLRGKISENTDATPYIKTGDRTPYAFSYDISLRETEPLLANMSHPYDDIRNAAIHVRYTEPYRISEAPDDQLTSSVSVEITGKLYSGSSSEPPTDVSQFYLINDDESRHSLTATISSEYSRKDTSLSRMKMIPDERFDTDDPRRYYETIEAIHESTRAMTAQDLDQLRQIINYIEQQPPIIEE